jgi:sulfate permease, SulP family
VRDLAAGLGVAAILVPQGMAYGQLAGLEPVVGLYAALGAMVAFALVSSTRQVIVGPESSVAAISAATVAGLADGDPQRALALSAALALMIGGLLVIAGLIRLGFLAEFLSRPVLLGYLMGVGLIVISSQVPRLFGFDAGGENFFTIVWRTFADLGETNVPTLILGVALIAVSLAVRRYAPRFPSALLVLVVATGLSALFDLRSEGVAVVGEVPRGLPSLGLPDVSTADLRTLMTGAGAIALVVYADSIATARSFAARHGDEVDPNRESVAIGLANTGAGFFGGFGVSASGSRTAVNDGAGARSQVAQLVAAAALVVVLLLLTPLLTELPVAALAAVVIAATLGLFDLGELRELWRLWRSEATLAIVTLLGVALLGVIPGLGVAVFLALANLVYRATRPHDAVLAREEGQLGYRDIRRLDAPLAVPSLVIYRFDAPLFFANAEAFRTRVEQLVAQAAEPVRGVLVDAEAIFYVDSSAIAMLQRLRGDLRERGIWLGAARMKTPVRRMISRAGEAAPIDDRDLFPTVREAVDAFEAGVS